MTTAATFDKIEKTYKTGPFGRGGVAAVRGVTLTIPAGGVFGLLGPNRAGKTTLVKLLLSLSACRRLARSRGWASRSTTGRTLGRVGYMHENHAFPRYLTAAELLAFYGGLSGVPSADLDVRVEKQRARVGLADRKAEPIARFSKGMVQRLGLAQCWSTTPTCSSSTSRPRGSIWAAGCCCVRSSASSRPRGRPWFWCRTVLPEVQELCDRVAVLVAGKIVHEGSLADLLKDAKAGKERWRGRCGRSTRSTTRGSAA